MPAIQIQIEGTTLNHRVKGRSLLLHLKKKDQISIVESLKATRRSVEHWTRVLTALG